MVDSVAENKYIQYKMSQMPDEKPSGQTHTIKKGESLWSLAKNAISGKGKVSNAQVSDYMLRIAKLNGLDTVEKMNNLKANTTLYMPTGYTETVTTNPQQAQKPQPPKKNSAEESASSAIETILNDNTVFIQRTSVGGRLSTLHHACNKVNRNNYISNNHPVMSFNMDEKGKLISISFEDINQNLNPIAYDYDMDSTGRIYRHNNDLKKQQIGRISREELQQLEAKLGELRKTAIRAY